MAASAPPSEQHLDLHLLRASFLGSLYVKAELTSEERSLLSWAARGTYDGMYTAAEILAAADVGRLAEGTELETFALRVLDGERLNVREAELLGGLLYGVDEGSVGWRPVKALVAHVMRVRHETDEELSGLALAAKKTLRADWFDGVGLGERRFALVAEPFDGTITADLLTPLVCKRLREYGLNPVMAVGESSGPKYGPNLRDVAKLLGVPFCESGAEVSEGEGPFGVAVDQYACSPGLAGWTRTRRTILKRPSIATTEKYVDACPGGARLFVGSAFHGAYVGKMASAAEAVGFEAYIIVGKGMEGTVGLGVGERRTATLMTGWRRGDRYGREEVTFNVLRDGDGVALGGEDAPQKGSATAEVTARRIQGFVDEGSSGDRLFDARARSTVEAFDKALAVLAREAPDVISRVPQH